MSWLIFGLALIVGGCIFFRGLIRLDPRKAVKLLLYVFGFAFIGLLGLIAIRGGIGYAAAAASFILPIFFRWRQLRQYFRNLQGPTVGANTDVKTKYLKMSLDHDTGKLDGLVLKGRFEGSRLGELTEDELCELLRECRLQDPESEALIEAYLDRVHGSDWRSEDERRNGPTKASSNLMSREDALEILGLKEGATASQVKQAHREKMKLHHPDQGGSNYFATKLNEAKELLLRS